MYKIYPRHYDIFEPWKVFRVRKETKRRKLEHWETFWNVKKKFVCFVSINCNNMIENKWLKGGRGGRERRYKETKRLIRYLSLTLITFWTNPFRFDRSITFFLFSFSNCVTIRPSVPRYRARKRDKDIWKWLSTFARSKIYLLISVASSPINSSRPCNDAGIRIFPPVRLSTRSRFRPSSKLVSTQVCLWIRKRERER